jgi:NitT/TauT family transport system substrate-binding protein
VTAKMLNVDVGTVSADAQTSEIMTAADLDKLTTDGTVDKWFNGMQDYFVTAGKIPAKVDPKTFYTGDLFTAAGK